MHAWARKISESENLKPEMFVFTIKFCRACSSADAQYVGETDRKMKERFAEHQGYVMMW